MNGLCLWIWVDGLFNWFEVFYYVVFVCCDIRRILSGVGVEWVVFDGDGRCFCVEWYGSVFLGKESGYCRIGKGGVCDGIFYWGWYWCVGEFGGCEMMVLESGW